MQFQKYLLRVLVLILLLVVESTIGMAQTKKPAPKKATSTAHKPATKKPSSTAHKTNPKPSTTQHATAKKTSTAHKSTTHSTTHKTTNTTAKKGTTKSTYHPTSKGKTAYKGKKKSTAKKKKKYPSKPYVPYNYHEKDMAQRDSFLSKKNINLSIVNNQDLLTQVYQWYGVPYRYGGMAKTGTDCAGFVKSVFKAIYNVDLARSATAQYPQCRQVIGEPHEGDLVFFNIRGRYLSHVGIYLQNGYFAHAATHSGVIISNLNEPYYKAYFYRFGAPPTVPGTFIVPINDSIPMHIEEPDSDSLDATH
ncbi:MAG: NlpC/P60 family protein [Chitinophagales bacterium]|jgi:cell wall-associated NlpC family hydrolase|nr:NlpC/P60 family protein [Chitinophagales bacterium]